MGDERSGLPGLTTIGPSGERGTAAVAACAFGVAAGGRILRLHDVRAARHVAELYAAVRDAAAEHEPRRSAGSRR